MHAFGFTSIIKKKIILKGFKLNQSALGSESNAGERRAWHCTTFLNV